MNGFRRWLLIRRMKSASRSIKKENAAEELRQYFFKTRDRRLLQPFIQGIDDPDIAGTCISALDVTMFREETDSSEGPRGAFAPFSAQDIEPALDPLIRAAQSPALTQLDRDGAVDKIGRTVNPRGLPFLLKLLTEESRRDSPVVKALRHFKARTCVKQAVDIATGGDPLGWVMLSLYLNSASIGIAPWRTHPAAYLGDAFTDELVGLLRDHGQSWPERALEVLSGCGSVTRYNGGGDNRAVALNLSKATQAASAELSRRKSGGSTA